MRKNISRNTHRMALLSTTVTIVSTVLLGCSGTSDGQESPSAHPELVDRYEESEQAYREAGRAHCRCWSKIEDQSYQKCLQDFFVEPVDSPPELSGCDHDAYACAPSSSVEYLECRRRVNESTRECIEQNCSAPASCWREHKNAIENCRTMLDATVKNGLDACIAGRQPQCRGENPDEFGGPQDPPTEDSDGDETGGESTSPDDRANLEQCRREFFEKASRNGSLWYAQTCQKGGQILYGGDCDPGDRVVEWFLEFRSPDEYFVNSRLHPNYINNANFGGWCRNPGTRGGAIRWEMADCDTARLYTGCGETELVEIDGDRLLYESRHGTYRLERWSASFEEKWPRNPYRANGCYTDDPGAEPRCE